MSTENTAPGILESVLAAVLHADTRANEQSDKLDRLLAIADELLALVRAHNAAVKAAETGVAVTTAVAPAVLVAAPVAPVGLATPTAPVFAAPVIAGESPQFAATKAAMYALANAKGREAAFEVLAKFGADKLGAVKESDLQAAQAAFAKALT